MLTIQLDKEEALMVTAALVTLGQRTDNIEMTPEEREKFSKLRHRILHAVRLSGALSCP